MDLIDKRQPVTLLTIGDKVPLGNLLKLYSRFPQVLNLVSGEQIISLVTREIGAGPFNLVLSAQELNFVQALEYRPGLLILNGTDVITISDEQIYHSEIDFSMAKSNLVRKSVNQLKELYLNCSHSSLLAGVFNETNQNALTGYDKELTGQFLKAYGHLQKRDFAEAASGFKGRGNGLTPAGDDFNVGLLLGLFVYEQTQKKELSKIRSCIYHNSLGKNLQVNTFLLTAWKGWFDANWQALLAALMGREGTIDSALQRVLARGESSGADTLAGFLTAWEIKI